MLYKVYEIDDCFEDYGISSFYTGANDENDLIEHLYEIGKTYRGLTKKQIKTIIKNKEWSIKEIEHLFTDIPYIVLDSYGYIE